MLFSGIINEIIKDPKIKKIYTIDYQDGALNSLINDSEKLEKIYFEDRKKINVPKDTILVMQSIVPYMIRDELLIDDKTKLFFWNLHPENLVPNFIPFHFLNNIIRSNYIFFKRTIDFLFAKRLNLLKNFIKLSIKNNSLMFMDSSNLYNTYFKLNLKNSKDVEFLPIPVRLSKKNKKINGNKVLSVSWVGRVEGFKFNILIYILNKLSKYCFEKNIEIHFHLIGDGTLLEEVKKIKFSNNLLKIKVYGNLNYKDLIILLYDKVNLSFAMGTSALDSAKIGIPTILVDYSFKKIKNYKFRWIFDTENFDLAHEIENNEYRGPVYSLNEIINQYLKDKKKLSIKSKKYVLEKHDINILSKTFLKKISNSKLEFGKIDKRILKKSLLRKLYYKFNNYYTGKK